MRQAEDGRHCASRKDALTDESSGFVQSSSSRKLATSDPETSLSLLHKPILQQIPLGYENKERDPLRWLHVGGGGVNTKMDLQLNKPLVRMRIRFKQLRTRSRVGFCETYDCIKGKEIVNG